MGNKRMSMKDSLLEENIKLQNQILDLQEIIETAKDELSYYVDRPTLLKAFGEECEDEVEELNFG